ncbi:MAG: leucine-rich repeat protein [Lachnospiraceae bacterium]|nr:leucine-rich repeat protein [Lachnospiraceae bacterium]
MIKRRFWKQSISMFLACSMVLTSSCFDVRLGNVTWNVANVQAKEKTDDELEAKQASAAEENIEAAKESEEAGASQQDGEDSVSRNETGSLQQVQDDLSKEDTEGLEKQNHSENNVSDQIQQEEAEDIILGNVKEVKSGSAASTVISDEALLKGLSLRILGSEDRYSSMTVDDLSSYTGEIDFSEYEKAGDIKSLKGLGYAKKATAFRLQTCMGVKEIPEGEFMNCSMTAVTFPDTITKIDDQAFYNCSKLAKIISGSTEDSLPPYLETVGSNAFEQCAGLTKIIIPDTVDAHAIQHATSIFAKCTSLTSVTIGSSITNIPVSAFLNSGAQGGMEVEVNGEAAKLEKIGSKAFSGANVSSLDLSNCTSLGTFDGYAFEDSKLQKITLPDRQAGGNNLFFSEAVFYHTPLDTLGSSSRIDEGKVIIPEYVSVTDKSASIFENCTSITYVNIPASWTLIPPKAFMGCGGLKEAVIGSDSKLSSIGEEAFCKAVLEDISFLNNCAQLTAIGKSAFEQCAALKEVVLPASVITVGEQAFYGESQLESFQWSYNGNAAKSGNERSLGVKALAENTLLTNVVLPDYSAAKEVFIIKEAAFANCSSLVTIGEEQDANKLPASVSAIGNNAFKGCGSLVNIKVQKNSSQVELGDGIFEECLKLTTVELPDSIDSIPSRTFFNAGVTSLTIGTVPNKLVSSTLEKIGARSFFGCQIEELDLSGCSALKEIGGWAFAGQDTDASVPANQREKSKKDVQLKKVILPEGLEALFINSGAFCLASQFTTLATPNHYGEGTAYIPDYVKSNSDGVGIGEGVFSGTAITSARIPAGWTGILPKYTFELCLNMTSLDFLVNTNLSGLGESCFGGCIYLKDIHLAGNHTIKNIGKQCFELCTGIQSTQDSSMTLPASLEAIGERAFYDTAFQHLDLSGNDKLQTVGQGAFRENNELATVNWSPSMSVMPRECFANDGKLKQVNFQSVKEIQQNAFSACIALDLSGTNLDSVEIIGNNAFQGCKSLNAVKFGPNLKSIGNNAFYQCAEIETADGNVNKTMSDSYKISFDFSNATSLTKISTSAFAQTAMTEFDISKTAVETVEGSICKSCELLKEVNFGTSVKYISVDALAGCPKLEKVSLYSTTVIEPKAFNSRSDISKDTTDYRVSITVKPAKEAIKVGINETMDFPYYVHMENSDKNAPELKAFRYIVVGDLQNSVPESDREQIFMAVSGNVEGYFINTYDNDTTRISGQYVNSEGGMSDNFDSQSSYKKNDAETNKKAVDVFRVTGVKEGSYPLYVCCQVQFPLNNSYETGSCIKTDFTTKYQVEVIKAWYQADLYRNYDNKNGVDGELQANSVTNLQVDAKNEKPKIYYDLKYSDKEMDSSNIKDWNVTVVSDNPSVMYPGKNASDGTAKITGATPGTITTTVAENNKNNQSQKYFYLIPAGVGTAHITVYPASHPAGSANAGQYAKRFTYTVSADLRSVQLIVPSEKRILNPGQSAQIETKITNCLNQTVTVTSAAELAKYTNNKLVYTSNCPELLTVNQNGLVKAVSAESKQKSVDVSVIATKSDGKTVSAKGTISVKWPEIKEGENYQDAATGAVVTVSKKGDKDGEVTYQKAASTTETTIKIPSTVTIAGVEYKVTKIASSAFKNNKKLKSITIPASVTEIGSKAFYNCTALKKITIGSNVTTIGSSAFYNCKALTSVTIGKKVTSIGSKAFYNCTALKKITIGSNVTTIGSSAFYNCKALTSVTIGKKVTSIGSKAFYNCKKLKKITIKSTVLAKVGSKAFKNIYKKAVIKVPKKKLADYKVLLKGKGQAKTVKIKK